MKTEKDAKNTMDSQLEQFKYEIAQEMGLHHSRKRKIKSKER